MNNIERCYYLAFRSIINAKNEKDFGQTQREIFRMYVEEIIFTLKVNSYRHGKISGLLSALQFLKDYRKQIKVALEILREIKKEVKSYGTAKR